MFAGSISLLADVLRNLELGLIGSDALKGIYVGYDFCIPINAFSGECESKSNKY